ncbi:DUF2891 domain-containing protein [Maricaulis sp.]|uniref:DUF2891 domain-containing protein n=1 Tax=Maricaulis sp. TaxID=1486257 RepID=UPI0025B9D1FA|nr:DUF2891 domain-containing protein [Maricaulis sp.]
MLSRTFFVAIANFAFLCSNIAEAQPMPVMQEQKSHFLQLALDCVDREYPNKISHVLQSDSDARTPRDMHPAFYGCYDWHSAVHGHWLIVRLLRGGVDADAAALATAALDAHLNAETIAGEIAYFEGEGTASFERPYGLAWLLQLGLELREWDDPRAARWSAALAPLETAVADRYRSWLPNLAYPIRIGTHNQSAFGFALALDWARHVGDEELETLLVETSLRFHRNDRACPISYEPSGEDFLSPCLMEADLMRRILDGDAFADWLTAFLPDIPVDGSGDWLEPGIVLDPSDGKLVHLDGVNLSRAWNLEAIAFALPSDDPRRETLLATSARHAETGLAAVTGDDYAGGHWLASFATYLVTGRALEAPR